MRTITHNPPERTVYRIAGAHPDRPDEFYLDAVDYDSPTVARQRADVVRCEFGTITAIVGRRVAPWEFVDPE